MAIQAMKCEICGSNDLVKQSGLYVCQHCGTKYTVEEARQLIGTVKIDKTDDMEKWRTLARRARREGNAQNAANAASRLSGGLRSHSQSIITAHSRACLRVTMEQQPLSIFDGETKQCLWREKQHPAEKRMESQEDTQDATAP